MALFLLTALTMLAFAGNSVLNRLGVAGAGMDPMIFAVIRVAAGAGMLWLIVGMRKGPIPALATPRRFAAAVALSGYMIGFSWAYLSLGAGLGALILFGVLQVAMFGWALVEGQKIAGLRWAGAGIAIAGLTVLLWPTGTAQVPLTGAIAMAVAGLAWAAYTLLGRGGGDPLGASAANFLLCLPLTALAMITPATGTITAHGILIAVLAGAVTSGLGYALWYRVLPQIATTTAAIAQLSVPVIAVAAGVLLLGEPVTTRLIVAGGLVLGGIGLSLLAKN